MKLLDKKFNSKWGVVQEQDRSNFKNHKDGMRSFEPIDGRLIPVAITFFPENCSEERFLQETGIDLSAKYCTACDKIEVDYDQQLCDHCAQDENVMSIAVETDKEKKKKEILIEGIRNWRLVKAQKDGIADLEEMTIGEAKILASFLSRTHLIDVTWNNIFQHITNVLRG